MFAWMKRIFGTAQQRTISRYRKVVKAINRLEEEYQSLSDEAVKAKTDEFRQRLSKDEAIGDILPEAFAIVKNVCRRLWGTEIHVSGYDQKWDMIPYDVQIIGAITMFHNSISEMQTGEGKTLTATMPLYLHALTGNPVHVVTVNDYLAKRDCEWMGAIFTWLGLSVGALVSGIPPHERKALYEHDILYGTASEFGFDHLRDNSMVTRKEDQVQRGHYFALIDEIDSILIDEARTPLIISGPVPVSTHMYDKLQEGVAQLVVTQRNLCNRIASEARKSIDNEDDSEEQQQAYRKLWLVSKGTPRNKIVRRIMEDPDKRAILDSWETFFHSDQNKEDKKKLLGELFIIIDERGNEYELTDKGIAAWQKYSSDNSSDPFVMLDLNDEHITIDNDNSLSAEEKMQKKMELQDEDRERKERAHNLKQLLRAHLLMEKDVDYITQEGKIIIIDENTGRPQPGRRFSNGLHQAIEAKESVAIQKETQTYATITLQNYFRMYDMLSGMTGTAITEAGEFNETYGINVLQIPTNRPCQRNDNNDEVYMTEREKYHALLKDIKEVHTQGRPILLGTESVEVSEKLSRVLKQNDLPHTVLNAKNHAREAEIIAEAGLPGAITIATNMAGRGTDIKLKPGIAEIGGLYVMGTTRHQSRRIDRQLRGRCARQGDPGSSKFYISFEDPLMRLFASPKVTNIIKRFRPPEGEPISARILDKAIETAQKRVEQRNFVIRKHTLQYDDVMNKQRHEIYAFRNKVLYTDDIFPIVKELLSLLCSTTAEDFFASRTMECGWDPEGYRQWLLERFPIALEEGCFDDEELEIEDIENNAAAVLFKACTDKACYENQKVAEMIQHDADNETPRDYSGEAIKNLIIKKIDQAWQEHLLTMDHLRSEVHLHAIAQKDPLTEFKHEAFRLFDTLGDTLRQDIAKSIFTFRIVPHYEGYLQQVLSQVHLETNRSLATDLQQEHASPATQQNAPPHLSTQKPVHAEPKIQRNALCPCGSGKKYKKCCAGKGEEPIP